MAREIGPMHRCGRGGDCPDCCAKPPVCGYCGDRLLEDGEEVCERCAEVREEREAEARAARDEMPWDDFGSEATP